MPQIESYDGVKDPLDHLEIFKTLMHLQGVPDEIMCKAFPIMLKGAARIWFSRLTRNSINTFKELSAQFTSHFIGGHRYKKSTACLMSIKQWEDETLRSYITHFNKEALSINEANDKILVAAFTNGLRKGKFLFSLYKNDPKTMFEVLNTYIPKIDKIIYLFIITLIILVYLFTVIFKKYIPRNR